MSEPSTSVLRARSLAAMPSDRYGEIDTERLELLALRAIDAKELTRRLDVDPSVAELALRSGEDWVQDWRVLVREQPELVGDLRLIHGHGYHAGEAPLHVVDVVADGPVLSDTPFTLVVHHQNGGEAPVVLVSVAVTWAGEPFVVEQLLDGDKGDGRVEVRFGDEQTLPVGPAELVVTIHREDGAQSTFRRGVYVLPANPLALSLGPAGARVTGSWSARGDYLPASDTFLTECEITIANGDGGGVAMNRRVSWEFWDGGVGAGTRVESGSFDWPSAITVGAHGVWRGTCWFSSPRHSPIFDTYDRKEDLALSIRMTAADGRSISGAITARVLLAYGVNIIKVGAFGAQEHVDLYDAVDRMRQIYERRDITLRGVNRHIIADAQAGSYPILNSEDEIRDLWEEWSVPNDFIDVYVAQDFQWSTFNGLAGDIPGPASKGGRKDGVAAEKTGFTDASGTARLDVATLAQLIGHEVGHYLGLPHLEDANNLMRSNTGNRGPDLNYDQYRLMFPHGFMRYE